MSENSGSERQEEVGPRVSISVGNVDLGLLGEQRAALVTVVDEMDLESLQGLLNFLDACVDCALDREQGRQPPTIVVDVTEGGCHGVHVAGELREAVRLELRDYDVSGLDPEDLVIDGDGAPMTVIADEVLGGCVECDNGQLTRGVERIVTDCPWCSGAQADERRGARR